MIQATVAIYPLGQETNPGVDRAIAVIEASGLEHAVRPMQTELLGPTEQVFATLQAVFEAAAEGGATVMTVTLSNACPLPGA
jgi:uncharacterized protein YqgV (UPF0045/DUF77 family)